LADRIFGEQSFQGGVLPGADTPDYKYHVNKEENIMPKMKTKRAAAKRFKTTGTGKLMKMKAYKSHILNKKTTKRKRNLRKAVEVDATNAKMMKRILPYAK